jgi:serine/threonine-protein kinase
MAVLQALASRPGEVVTRTELLSAIWPGGTTYDEALTQCVYQLRQQLISAGGNNCRNLITTVPKRGYLLEAEVSSINPEPKVVEVTAGTPHPRRGLSIWLVAAVLTLVAAGWAAFQLGSDTDAGSNPPQAQIIAVLPFLPLVEDERDPALEFGMAETLITRLSEIGQLTVRPISSVRWFDKLDRDALAAGRQLGVDAVVDGNIQRAGEEIRVTVRLLRVADGAALWTDAFNERFSGIFAVQDAISEHIITALALQLGQQERKVLARAGTASAEAYRLYLQGQYHLARLTPKDLQASLGYFREAVALDPGYAQAWLGLSDVQFRSTIAGQVPPPEYYPLAKRAAQKALELDPSLAQGYAMLGRIAFWFEWDWAASEAHFIRAIELNPNDAESHLGYAHLLSNIGRHEQALTEIRRARELSPMYPVAAALEGGFLSLAGQLELALQILEQAREQHGGFWLVRNTLAAAYARAGRNTEALAEVRLAREASGGSTWAAANEVGILVRLDQRAEAEALLAEMVLESTRRYVPPYDLAVGFRAIGDLDAAMAALEQAYEVRDPKLTFLGVGGWQENFGDRPEYIDLMQRMDLTRFFK